MTKEQAIEFLKEYTETIFSEKCRDAHNMAIKALEQQPSEDCVSRQAVVEYIKACGAELGHDCESEIVVEDILNMPSVTPTRCIAEIKFSKDDLREICNERIEVECTHGTWKYSKFCYDCGNELRGAENE